MKNIYLIRPVGFNVGNHVIYVGLRNLIRDVFEEEVNIITVPATAKYDSYGRPGLSSPSIFEINQYGDGVIVGGGNLLENGELDVDLDALSALMPPMMLFSLSWGRVYDRFGTLTRRTDTMSDRTAQALVEAAEVVVARDDSTQSFMRSVSNREVLLGGCPTLFLKARSKEKADRKALISIRNPGLMSISPGHQAAVRRQIDTAQETLADIGLEADLLCHDHRDVSFAASFPHLNYRYIEDPREFLAALQATPVLVTYRLHSFIPAAVFGTPAVKVSYDERAVAAMRTLGLRDWNINLFDVDNPLDAIRARILDSESLAEAWTQATPTLDHLKSVQRGAMQQFRDSVYAYSDKV